jgi:hypothetical protein
MVYHEIFAIYIFCLMCLGAVFLIIAYFVERKKNQANTIYINHPIYNAE